MHHLCIMPFPDAPTANFPCIAACEAVSRPPPQELRAIDRPVVPETGRAINKAQGTGSGTYGDSACTKATNEPSVFIGCSAHQLSSVVDVALRMQLTRLERHLDAKFGRQEELVKQATAQQTRVESTLRLLARGLGVEVSPVQFQSQEPQDLAPRGTPAAQLADAGAGPTAPQPLVQQSCSDVQGAFAIKAVTRNVSDANTTAHEAPLVNDESTTMSRSIVSMSRRRLKLAQPNAEDMSIRRTIEGVSDSLKQVRRAASLESKKKTEHTLLHRMVGSQLFDYSVFLGILANSVFLGVQVDWLAQTRSKATPKAFQQTMIAFNIFFIFELSLRICAERIRFFISINWKWNLFDLLIVLVSCIELLIGAFMDDNMSTSKFFLLRMTRFFRFVRVIRVIRVVKFFAELRLMIYSIFFAIKSLLWTVILVAMIMYVVGITLTQSVAETPIVGYDADTQKALHNLYGSLFKSMYTLFTAVTGGNDWSDLVTPLLTMDPMLGYVFVMYVTFMFFAVLNIVTGVFVEGAIRTAKDDNDLVIRQEMASEEAFLKEMRLIFSLADRDDSGTLSAEEVEDSFEDERTRLRLKRLGLDVADVNNLFKLLDTNDSGQVGCDDFVLGCLRLRGESKSIDTMTLMYENKRMMKTFSNGLKVLEDQIGQLVTALNPKAGGAKGDSEQQPSGDGTSSSPSVTARHSSYDV